MRHLNPDKKQLSVDDAIDLITRYHTAFTPKTMERVLYSTVKDKEKRSTLMTEILKSDRLIQIGQRGKHAVFTLNP